MTNNIIDICYARVSTQNVSQMPSLNMQDKLLRALNRGDVMVEIHSSGKNGLSSKFKTKILELHNGIGGKKQQCIRLNVTSMDRLTRNFDDINFLKRYIKYIYVLDQNKTYDFRTDIKLIVEQITENSIDYDNICIRNQQSVGRKRPRNTNEDNILNTIVERCNNVDEMMKNAGITIMMLNNLHHIIHISQNLTSQFAWQKMFKLINNMHMPTAFIETQYATAINKRKGYPYELRRREIFDIIQCLIKTKKYKVDDSVIKIFVNANIRYGQKFEYDNKRINENMKLSNDKCVIS